MVNKLLTTMTAIFTEAVRLFGRAISNPASTAQRLGVGSVEASGKDGAEIRPEEIYNAEELNRLILGAEPGFNRTLIFTVAMTGMRHGEALGLQWGDIDLAADKITVRRTWPDKWRGEEPIFYVPKSKNGVREIPIPGELVQALKRWKLACPISQWDLVFPKKDGAPHDRKTVRALSGNPCPLPAPYLGHADPQITLKVFSHWIPRTKTDSISRLAGMILNAKTPASEDDGHSVDTSEKQNLKKRV